MRTAAWTETVSVLDRMTAILDAFGELETMADGLGVTELARRANLPKSTVSRIAADLVEEGYLDRVDGRLYIGLRIFEMGQSVEEPKRLRRLASGAMVSLRDATGGNVQLAIADGDDVIVIANARGRDPRFAAALVGERLPATHTALGAALAADDELLPTLPAVHVRHHGEHVCVAVPVRERGVAVAALAVGGSVEDVDASVITPDLRRAAASIAQSIAESSRMK